MKTREEVQRLCYAYERNSKTYTGPKIEHEYKFNELKLNEAMLYAIAKETGATSYEMFEYFHGLSSKVLTLFNHDKYRSRQQFMFYGTYPESTFNFIISIKKEWYGWNEQYYAMDSNNDVVVDYNADKFKYNSWGSPKHTATDEQLARIDHYKCIKRFSVNVSIPTRAVCFKSEKIEETLIEKELLGFSALAEPEDPNLTSKRRSINDIDKMIEDANTVSIKKGKKERENAK